MGVQERIDQWFGGAYAAIAADLRSQWDAMANRGCWCGSDVRCGDDPDGESGCCRRHVADYRAAGINADRMWSPDGFVRGKEADLALVACAGSRPTRDEAYRARLTELFSMRVALAEVIEGWYAVARRAQEEIDRFDVWLSAGEGSPIAASELDRYRSFLAEVGVPEEEVEAVLADHAPTIGPSGALA